MPLPKPKNKEKKSDFVSRCIGDNQTNKDFPDQKQRIAVCYSQWEKAKKEADVVAEYENEEFLYSAQKTYMGKKRSELKDSDFLFPETRSFPIVSPQDVRDAISNFGRMGGNMSYDAFVKKLYNKAKSKGSEFVSAIPETTRQKYNLRASEEDMQNGDDEEYECEDCGYEGGEAEKCPECGSENYDEKEMEEEVDAEELTAENLYTPSEEEYLKAEEINLDPSEFEELNIEEYFKIETANAAEYQGRKVTLNKPFRTPGGPKKSAVYVKNSSGKVVIVRFGDPNMKIKKNIPARRKSFRARHKCDQATDKTTPRYWACKSW